MSARIEHVKARVTSLQGAQVTSLQGARCALARLDGSLDPLPDWGAEAQFGSADWKVEVEKQVVCRLGSNT